MIITADRLNDYMMGRVRDHERVRIRRALAADPAARRALRRLRGTARALRARCGDAGDIAGVPREWISLLDSDGPLAPMSAADLARGRTLTWL